MANTVRLTWAIPVSAHLLGARLEAYVESKATISTFRLCARHGNPLVAPAARLPAELIDDVVEYIELSFFEKTLPPWADVTRDMGNRWNIPWGEQVDMSDHLDMISGIAPKDPRNKRFARCREVQRLDSIDKRY